MKYKDIRQAVSDFMSSDVISFSLCGKTRRVTGLCLTLDVLLVVMHVCMIKYISCRTGKLKERARLAEKAAEDRGE